MTTGPTPAPDTPRCSACGHPFTDDSEARHRYRGLTLCGSCLTVYSGPSS